MLSINNMPTNFNIFFLYANHMASNLKIVKIENWNFRQIFFLINF